MLRVRVLAGYLREASLAIFTAPLHWRAREWLACIAFGIALAASIAEKRALVALVHVPAWPDVPAVVADRVGGGVPVAVFGVALGVAGLLLRSRRMVDAAVVLGVAGIWTFAFTQLGQLVLAEARPIDGGAMHFFARGGHGVSGHASAAGVLFSPVRMLAKKRHIATIALVLWMLLVGWSRVWLGLHHVWNVVLGLGIGFWIGHEATVAFARRVVLGSQRDP